MKRKLWLLALVVAMLLSVNPVLADGDFYVVAVGGGVGTKITSVPYTISNPGFYYLSGNLTYSGTEQAIIILSDNVTLDLMGFSLTGAGKYISGFGIAPFYLEIFYNNVEIRNGTVSGFGFGVYAPGANIRVSRIRAFNNKAGIWISGGVVEGCTASNHSEGGKGNGIQVASGRISGCVASNNSGTGISLNGPGAVIGNVANNNTICGFGLNPLPMPIMVDQNSADGNGTNYGIGTNDKISWGVNAGRPMP